MTAQLEPACLSLCESVLVRLSCLTALSLSVFIPLGSHYLKYFLCIDGESHQTALDFALTVACDLKDSWEKKRVNSAYVYFCLCSTFLLLEACFLSKFINF